MGLGPVWRAIKCRLFSIIEVFNGYVEVGEGGQRFQFVGQLGRCLLELVFSISESFVPVIESSHGGPWSEVLRVGGYCFPEHSLGFGGGSSSRVDSGGNHVCFGCAGLFIKQLLHYGESLFIVFFKRTFSRGSSVCRTLCQGQTRSRGESRGGR